jgi:hypothetical protein
VIKSALLGVGLVAAVATTAAAQTYYIIPTTIPVTATDLTAIRLTAIRLTAIRLDTLGATGWPYSWPYYYPAPAYRAAPAYTDPYVWWRPYSDNAGPKASTRGGF